MSRLDEAIEKITEQQPKDRTPVWMVGEQLKDILRAEPELAEIVLEDLEGKPDALVKCEKEIKAFADKHRSGNSSCVIPAEADRIIREFFGLPKSGETPAKTGGNLIDLGEFFK